MTKIKITKQLNMDGKCFKIIRNLYWEQAAATREDAANIPNEKSFQLLSDLLISAMKLFKWTLMTLNQLKSDKEISTNNEGFPLFSYFHGNVKSNKIISNPRETNKWSRNKTFLPRVSPPQKLNQACGEL